MSEYDAKRFIDENISDRRNDNVPHREICPTCDGAGDGYDGTCWNCNGHGVVER